MLQNAADLDAAIARLTGDPYRDLPRLVVMAATTDEPVVYAGSGGYAQLPAEPTEPSELARVGEPVNEDSIFELYSCTKLVAVIAGLQLVEQGTISVEDDASQYIPELKEARLFKGFDSDDEVIVELLSRPVTIHHLLTHTSGLLYTIFDPGMERVGKKLAGKGDVYGSGSSARLFEIPFAALPGEKFCYGYGLDYMTLIVEKLSGLPLEQYFKKHIFEPLGIADMSFLPNPKQMSMAFEDPATPRGPYAIRTNDPTSETQHFGGAGLKGSARSYLKIVRAILRGGELDGQRILRKETVDLMFKEQLTNDGQRRAFHQMAALNFDPSIRKNNGQVDPAVTHGYGGGLHTDSPTGKAFGTLSWSGLANTYWWVDRTNDLAAVVFTNVLPWGTSRVSDAWYEVEQKLYEGIRQK